MVHKYFNNHTFYASRDILYCTLAENGWVKPLIRRGQARLKNILIGLSKFIQPSLHIPNYNSELGETLSLLGRIPGVYCKAQPAPVHISNQNLILNQVRLSLYWVDLLQAYQSKFWNVCGTVPLPGINAWVAGPGTALTPGYDSCDIKKRLEKRLLHYISISYKINSRQRLCKFRCLCSRKTGAK